MTAGLLVESLGVSLPAGRGRIAVVRDVSLALPPGATLGLVGESGSGKSMVALSLMGLLPDGATTAGSVTLDGAPLLGAPDAAWRRIRGRRIAMVFQEPMTALNPTMTIGRQVAEAMRLHLGIDARSAHARAVALLHRVGMPRAEDWTARYPHQLSGGQRQRVAIAAALAADPDILIADEPTTALDVTLQAQVLDLLADLVRERGLALLLVTHDLAVVAELCRHLAVLYAGQVVEQGETAAILARPAHPYSAGLLACSPDIAAPRAARLPALPGTVPGARDWPASCAFAPRCARADEACRAAPVPVTPHAGRALRCRHPLPA
jgi:peptide/nickel transport system ATP-binding protein